jgi:hypothetical protein
MNAWLNSVRELVPSVVDTPAWTVLLGKITAILLAAWVFHLALARTNPRWRVFLWRMTAAGLIALPAAGLLVPALEIRVEPPALGTTADIAKLPQVPPDGPDTERDAPSDPFDDLAGPPAPYVPPIDRGALSDPVNTVPLRRSFGEFRGRRRGLLPDPSAGGRPRARNGPRGRHRHG